MCTKTFSCYTNSRFISKVNVVKFRNKCQCGFCSECIRQKKSEWALRSYYEALDCFSRGGFCLFDTLTYRDDDLHYFHDYYDIMRGNWFDFMSFSRDDIQRFFKRLRVNLCRDGYSVDGNLRYLLTSEYGSELCTNRPHYHVLFFVNFEIDPCRFSRYISEAWTHGITDGVKPRNAREPWYLYKSKSYVLHNRVFQSVSYDLNKLVNYVVKYISKDMYVYKKLFKRVYAAYTSIHPNWCQYFEQRAWFRRFKSRVLPFHLQSKGFGLFAIEKVGVDRMISFNSVPLPFQHKGITAFIPLPMYYKRKLFFRTDYFNGKLRWVLTDRGRVYRRQCILNGIENFALRLQSWNSSVDSVGLARYHFLRRGVLAPRFMSDCSDDELLDELLSSPNLKNLYSFGDLYYNYNTPVWRFVTHPFVSPVYHSELLPNCFSAVRWSQDEFVLKNSDLVSLDDVEKNSILESFESYLSSIGDAKDVVQSQKDEQLFRYKHFGML